MVQIDSSHIVVHENQLIVDARQFQGWRAGLPEWVKNSSDAYEAASVDDEDRVIVLISSKAKGGKSVTALACLDFVGMSVSALEDKLSDYGNPGVAGTGEKILGGHGNGGKLYAVGGFEDGALWHTIKNGSASVFGLKVPGKPGMGFDQHPTGISFKGKSESNLWLRLDEWLQPLGIAAKDLPGPARLLAGKTNGFTLTIGYTPREVGANFRLVVCNALEGHPQMRAPIESNHVYIMEGPTKLNDGKHLRLQPIPPYEEFETPRSYSIPGNLQDPADGTPISMTGPDGSAGFLELRTSGQPMVSKQLRARHTVDYLEVSKIRGSESIRDLVGKGPSSDRIYGKCVSSGLEEKYESQLRGPLVDAPYTRALRTWLVDRILELAAEMDATAVTKQKEKADEQMAKRLIEQMTKLNQWINRVVTEISVGFGLDGDDGFGGPPSGPPRPPLPKLKVDNVEISIDSNIASRNIPLRFSAAFYSSDGIRVRPVSIEWRSSDPNVADFSSLTGMINTYDPGYTQIWGETYDGVTSNQETIRVVDCADLVLDDDQLELAVGQRRKVGATGISKDQQHFKNIRLHWTSNDEAVRVGPAGIVTGVEEGDAIVVANGGNGLRAELSVKVAPANFDQGGPARPRYLLSEIQRAPYDKEPPFFHQDEGLVVQRATKPDVEFNIWWINRASRLARFLASERGVESEQWLLYLAERMADAAIEASILGADRGSESRQVAEIVEEIAQKRNQILESFMAEFGSTNQLVV